MGIRKDELPWKPIDTKDYEWNAYRTQYITSNITYDKLAKEHKLDPQLLRKRASREQWGVKRKEFGEALTREVGAQVVEVSKEALVEWNEDILVDAKRLKEAARRLFMKLENGKWTHRKDVAYGALGAAASAMMNADRIARLAMGASTDNRNNTNRNLPLSIEELV
jgi:hypothetical protein